MPEQRSVELVIHNWHKADNQASFNKNSLKSQASEKALTHVDQGLFYNEAKSTLTIKVQWDHSASSIKILKTLR